MPRYNEFFNILEHTFASTAPHNTTVVISPRARVQGFLARYLAQLGGYSLKVRFYEEESAGFTKRIS